MHFTAILVAAAAALSAPTVSALGINCRGSSNCGFASSHTLSEINTKVQGLADGNTYPNGQHIACVGNYCAFLQNIRGTKTGADVKGYVSRLLEHGCSACGSCPTEPGNDVSTGELTVNYVSNP